VHNATFHAQLYEYNTLCIENMLLFCTNWSLLTPLSCWYCYCCNRRSGTLKESMLHHAIYQAYALQVTSIVIVNTDQFEHCCTACTHAALLCYCLCSRAPVKSVTRTPASCVICWHILANVVVHYFAMLVLKDWYTLDWWGVHLTKLCLTNGTSVKV
jgi:hypothetical protein